MISLHSYLVYTYEQQIFIDEIQVYSHASAALWKREPISDDYLPSMRKAVLSISCNVYKQQEMEIDKLINDV
jgi:hypothetical protein